MPGFGIWGCSGFVSRTLRVVDRSIIWTLYNPFPEVPGTSLLRNSGLKTMIIMAFGAQVLNSLVSGPFGIYHPLISEPVLTSAHTGSLHPEEALSLNRGLSPLGASSF